MGKEILEGATRRMNIFYLHPDPLTAAEMHCDKHCVKMILETAQMLCTANRTLDGDEQADKLGMYKTAHLNHPSTKWVRGSRHKTDAKLRKALSTPPLSITDESAYTQPPQCMPDQYKVPDDAVQAYRNYYIGEKAYFAKWAYTRTPEWWTTH